MTPTARHLVVMAKAPRFGVVKTRLAADVGDVAALRFYRRTLARTLRTLRDPRWRCWLAVTPDGAAHDERIWPGCARGWTRIAQGSGGLGARMMRPMFTLPPGPVVVVGADIPAISRGAVGRAFHLLGDHDLVFGPATDGGFWLVGMKRAPRVIDPYAGVRWSTEHALKDTLANVPGEMRVGFTDTLADVDRGADLTP